jgi:hypothetical protein
MKTNTPRAARSSEASQNGDKSLFSLGLVTTTPGIIRLLEEHGASTDALQPFLNRHQSGDWGDLDEADKRENDLSVQEGFRVLSAYHLYGQKVWIITEADRSVTTVLLPREY